MPVDDRKIPEDIILGPARRKKDELQKDPDKWTDYEVNQVRGECGTQYAGIPIENVRSQLVNMRRRGLLPKLKGNGKNCGQTRREKPPQDYLDYLKTAHWKQHATKVKAYWGFKCALCCSSEKLDVHHRTYVNLGNEGDTDCIALCRKCHIAADKARKRQNQTDDLDDLFGPGDGSQAA